MIYTKDNFPEISSVQHFPLMLLVYGLFGLLGLAMVALFYALPLTIQLENGGGFSTDAIIFNLLYYPLLLWGSWLIIKNYNRTKKTKVQCISVDKQGIHYHLANGTMETIFYKQLERSTEAYRSDIDREIGSKHSPGFIFGFVNGERKRIDFDSQANGLSYLPKNKYELIGHFLQGVKLYNPNLSISKAVFAAYYIKPETFEYDKIGFRNTVITIIVLLLLILMGLYLFVFIMKR